MVRARLLIFEKGNGILSRIFLKYFFFFFLSFFPSFFPLSLFLFLSFSLSFPFLLFLWESLSHFLPFRTYLAGEQMLFHIPNKKERKEERETESSAKKGKSFFWVVAILLSLLSLSPRMGDGLLLLNPHLFLLLSFEKKSQEKMKKIEWKGEKRVREKSKTKRESLG